jgi:hypothetical protein
VFYATLSHKRWLASCSWIHNKTQCYSTLINCSLVNVSGIFNFVLLQHIIYRNICAICIFSTQCISVIHINLTINGNLPTYKWLTGHFNKERVFRAISVLNSVRLFQWISDHKCLNNSGFEKQYSKNKFYSFYGWMNFSTQIFQQINL